MRLHIIKTVFLKELREMLRDRRSLAVMFGVPLILYPVLTIGLGSLTRNKVSQLQETRYKIAVVHQREAPELFRRLADEKSGIELTTVADPMAALRSALVEAVLVFPKNLEADLLAGKDAAITLQLDHSRTEADFAQAKLNKIIGAYQDWVIARRLEKHGIPPDVLKGIGRNVEDVASAAQRMGNRLSQLLPLLVLITGMLGALFPALSATTTERELGTLETLLVTPAGRGEILLAKGLLVLVCGLLTAALNLLSMALVLWHTFSMIARNTPGGGASENLAINFGALGLMFLSAVPALIFFTTMVLIVGLLARTFREANSYATPAMLLPLASLVLTITDVRTTPALLVTPIANTTLIMRDVLRGRVVAWEIALAFGSSVVYAGLLLSVAARLFSNEQLVNPAWEPLSLKGLGKRKRRPRLPAVDEAVALFAVSMLLLFYVQPRLMDLGLFRLIAATQLLLILAPALVFAKLGNWQWRETFQLRAPTVRGAIGGVLLGVGLAPVIGLIGKLQQKVWPVSPEMARAMEQMFGPALASHPVLTALFVGAMAGICEELLYHGPIQTALVRRLPRGSALVLGALVFAAAHLDVRGLLLRVLLGVLLGWTVLRTRSIVPAILLHGLYDATAIGLAAWESGRYPSGPPLADGWTAGLVAAGLVLAVVGGGMVTREVLSAEKESW